MGKFSYEFPPKRSDDAALGALTAHDLTSEDLEALRAQFIREFNNPLGLPGNNHRNGIRKVVDNGQ